MWTKFIISNTKIRHTKSSNIPRKSTFIHSNIKWQMCFTFLHRTQDYMRFSPVNILFAISWYCWFQILGFRWSKNTKDYTWIYKNIKWRRNYCVPITIVNLRICCRYLLIWWCFSRNVQTRTHPYFRNAIGLWNISLTGDIRYDTFPHIILIGVLTARQHRKVNLCQLRGKETGSVG